MSSKHPTRPPAAINEGDNVEWCTAIEGMFSFIQPFPKVRRQCELAVGFTGAESWSDAMIPFRSWHHTTLQRAFACKRSFSSLSLILFHLFFFLCFPFDFNRPSPPKVTPAHISDEFLLAASGFWTLAQNTKQSGLLREGSLRWKCVRKFKSHGG